MQRRLKGTAKTITVGKIRIASSREKYTCSKKSQQKCMNTQMGWDIVIPGAIILKKKKKIEKVTTIFIINIFSGCAIAKSIEKPFLVTYIKTNLRLPLHAFLYR